MASGCPAPLDPPVPLPAGAGPVLGRRRQDRPSKAGRIRARPARAEPQSAQTRADDHPGRGVNVRAAVDDHSSTDHPGFERSRDRMPIVCRPRAEPSSYACRRTASTMAADLGNPRESANPRLTRFYGKTRTGRSARSSPAQSAPCVRARNRQVHKPADANPLAAVADRTFCKRGGRSRGAWREDMGCACMSGHRPQGGAGPATGRQ